MATNANTTKALSATKANSHGHRRARMGLAMEPAESDVTGVTKLDASKSLSLTRTSTIQVGT